MAKGIEQLVTLRVDGEHFGIPITQVYEIIFVSKLTGIARAPRSIIGVINLRGQIIPVIDLRLLFDKPKAEPTKRQRIVVTQSQGKIIGLLVDEVTEVLRILEGNLEAAPDTLMTTYTSYIDSIYKLEDRIVVLLQMDQLLINSEMDFIHSAL
ncbi:chemotaxis protein CheW [Paenibacillus agricola]|uniref:Chemotaxis protein CheW n=1 Tax=Paenibacillus agricola TaxID=2716264 RepID=A0ABX0J8X1_9BACL|nr:chemotaxis protein CheW [Paenibacillus agricola]NHN32810.1 chemotaxis protein CheW [Paenibacillus agricola]